MLQFHSERSTALRNRLCVLAAAMAVTASAAQAQPSFPGNLVVSRSVYTPSNAVTVGEVLPPGCTMTTGGCSPATGAVASSESYPFVFNNDTYDPSFGITSKILLDEITPFGLFLGSREVPNSTQRGVGKESNQLVTSFSSKSEMALHLSLDRQYLTFMGYVAPVNAVDISNSNTPAAVDPTNPVGENAFRAVATVDAFGNFTFTETNAYSGNNGRGVVYNNVDGNHFFYTAGNAGNGSNPQPDGVILGAGTQIITHSNVGEYQQNPGSPTPVGSFSVTELGDKADKVGKDDNFRGIAIFNNVLYYSKGSGSNGVNTVYFLDTTGTACPKGVGLPVAGAKLPATALAVAESTLQTTGLPSNMCILKGFPTALAKSADPVAFPFGIWFANATTLYIADEGDGFTGGTDLYTHAAAQTTAGLQKWIFDSATQSWNLAYTLQNGLGLGTPYTLRGYPTGTNVVTGLPWSPATDGLRNITGKLIEDQDFPFGFPFGFGLDRGHASGHAMVALYAISSTISGNGDPGADPNRLYVIYDDLANTDPTVAAKESFQVLRSAEFGEVLRGVSFTPGTENISSF
jgi:hypothetical protein